MVEPVFHVKPLRRWSAVVGAGAALLYAIYVWHSGPHLSSDSRTYSRWADALIRVHFDYRTYLATAQFVVPPVFYVLWVTTIALSKVLLGDTWPSAILFLNWLTASAVAYGLARTVGGLTRSTATGVAASLMFAAALDVLLFLPYVLSDIIFTGLAAAVLLFGLLIASEQEPHLRFRRVSVAIALLVIACIFRPTGAPLVVFLCGCVLIGYRRSMAAGQAWLVLAVIGVVALAAVVVHAALMQDPSRWPGGESGWIRQLSEESRKGIVVYDRPETYVTPPHTLVEFVALTLKKWAYYFAPWAENYSLFHKVASGAFLFTAYILSLVAVLWSPRWRVTSLLTLYMAAFSLFHAVQQIDYDFRYRLPILPALSVLAAFGLEQLAASATARRRVAIGS